MTKIKVTTSPNFNKIIFGLGSNLGDRAKQLQKAEILLEKKLALKDIKISEILPNKALLKPNSPKEWDLDFFNIAISAQIDIEKYPPQKILKIIKEIETQIGRKPTGLWAPREIDIDILAIDDLIINQDQTLQIPHKAIIKRDFFVKTIAQIEPNWRYPIKGKFYNKKIIEIKKELDM